MVNRGGRALGRSLVAGTVCSSQDQGQATTGLRGQEVRRAKRDWNCFTDGEKACWWTPDDRFMLSAEYNLERVADAFLDHGCSNVVEIGGYLKPLDDFLYKESMQHLQSRMHTKHRAHAQRSTTNAVEFKQT